MSRKVKIVLVVIVVLITAAIVVAWRKLDAFSHDMDSEYETIQVIDRVTEFVNEHHRWPANWQEVGGRHDADQLVILQFDVDIDKLISDPEAIQSTILPVTGPYNKAPGAKRTLERLRQKLIESQPVKPKETATSK